MSATVAAGRRTNKTTCRKCERTVIVEVIDGVTLETDPELIAVVPFETKPAKRITARRVHGEMCHVYRTQADRKKLKAAAARLKKR